MTLLRYLEKFFVETKKGDSNESPRSGFKNKIFYDFLGEMLLENSSLLEWERGFFNVMLFVLNYNKFAYKLILLVKL